MFTGIVTQRATVEGLSPAPQGVAGARRLAIRLEQLLPTLAVGDSLALDGCCLTVVTLDGNRVAFDVVPETLRRTTLGGLETGRRLNVEAALRAGDPLGGHLVQGHVDGVGRLLEVERGEGEVRWRIALPPALRGAALPKGSVTVDGVSLTVGECDPEAFSVYLIPHTLAVTGLGEKGVGDAVNLEADVIGRYVEHHVRRILGDHRVPAGAPGDVT